MRGEEFFGEVKEERLIDKDLSWLWFFSVVFWLCSSIYLYLYVTTIRIESLWTWSYWLEVMGFSLIIGDLFFEERTKKLLSVGEGYFTPGHANWIGWWKFAAIDILAVLLGVLTALLGLPSFIRQIIEAFSFGEFCIVFSLFYAIFSGPYFYILDKKNDRLLANGVGLALAGLTFATSAQIATTFF